MLAKECGSASGRVFAGAILAVAVALGPLGAGYAISAQGQGNHGHGQGDQGHGQGDQGHGNHWRGQDDQGQGDQGHGEHGREHEERDHRHGRQGGYYFREREIRVIRSYYGEHGSRLPPGLAKRGGNLPPGLEKHLERDGALPPGLQKRLTPLPYSLRRELPPLPRGCDCRIGALGRDVLIVNEKTNRILDIVSDVRDVIGR